MSRGTKKNTQIIVAVALIAALLAPAWPMAQASSGQPLAGMAAPQAAADRPDDLANVPGATAEWWTVVQEQIQQDIYALSEGTEDGGMPSYTGYNAAHGFDLTFSADGVRLAPAAATVKAGEEGGWRWGLRLTGYGYEGRVQPLVAQVQMTADGNQVKYEHAGVTEWYINDGRGLEQGFSLDTPPPAGGAGQALLLEMALDTDLVPALSDDGQRIDFVQPGGGAVLRYADLYVADAAGREIPAQLSLSPGRISIRIDDTGAAYPLLVDPVIATPDWTTQGGQLGAAFGTSVGTAGDLNGDGYDDVAVGAPLYDGGTHTDNGRVSVYYGSAGGLPATASWTDTGASNNYRFGTSAGTAGDVNGDGYDDLIVGVPGSFNGQVHVYYGSAAGLPANPSWTENGVSDAAFGTYVGTAGDVNGDGYDDIVVGAPRYDHGETDEGGAFVYHGSSSGLPTAAHWTAESNDAYAYFGTSVGTAGDVNGDGYDDLIVGAPDYTKDQNVEGGAFVYFGSASGLATAASWTGEGNQVGSAFGTSAGTAGDVNGDGYSDIVVGAPDFDYGQSGEGKVFVYHGSANGPSTTANSTAESDQDWAEFGTSVGTAGDVNRDGYDDIVVGAPGYDNGQTDEGRIYVYYGSPTGLPSIAQWIAESGQSGPFPETPPALGTSVGAAGDVNGDGYDDIIAGAPGYDYTLDDEGQVYAFLGPVAVTSLYQWSAVGETASAEFGRSVMTAGDLNGDGYSEIVIGAPYDRGNGASAGKIYVYAGSASGPSLTPAWTALGEAPNDEFGRAVEAAGDLNGDGYDDLVAGAPGHGGGGKVYVYYGSAAGPSPGWTASGQYAADEFGGAVSTAGDVNADGYDDLIVGAGGYPAGNAYGKVYVYHGAAGGLGAVAAWTAGGQSAGDRFGSAVSTAGDVNGDGYADIIAGAPQRNAQSGRVYGYHGGPGGLTPGGAAWTVAAGSSGDQFGYALDTAGDVNGDGYADVIIGAPLSDAGGADSGRAFVYLGAASGLSGTASWTANGITGSRLGTSLATAGDVNGDGYADVVVGLYGVESLSGAIYIYHGSQDGLPSMPDWALNGENPGDRLGLAVGTAGDVNGDGLSDVIAGAPAYDISGRANAGKAYVLLGRADWPSKGPAWSRTGATAGTAGDVNGDGYADVIVGSESANTVWAYYGGPDGLASTADWTKTGTVAFGRTVGTAGDVNGDGYADVAVSGSSTVYLYLGSAAGLGSGAASWTASGSSATTAGDVNGDGYNDVLVAGSNAVHVYHGSAAGIMPGSPAWSATGLGCYGCAAGPAGDVNGDGYADVIVGAKDDDAGGTDAGKVYLYLGSATGLAASAVWTATGAAAHEKFGTDVSAAGDVNGDGYADIVVGAPDSGSGKVYLFLGTPQGLDTPFLQLVPESSASGFGASVSTVGDVSGDGYADVIVSAPYTASNQGKVYLYYGGPLGLTAGIPAWTVINISATNLGNCVAGAGDVNGDGFADLLICSSTTAYLHLANGGGGRAALSRQTRGGGGQVPVQPWGSAYTASGFEVSLLVVNALGRGRARLQVQACPSGVPFGGASCSQVIATGWTDLVDAEGIGLSETALGPKENALYHWRARPLYDSPLVPHGPWRRLLGQAQEADVRVGMPATDLRITKTMTPTDELTPPASITYTLSFTAAGGPAVGVVITDILPASLENVEIISSGVTIYDTGARPGYVWRVGYMEAGQSGVITITGEASATRFVNTAVISSTSRDVNPKNNIAIVQTHIDGILYVDADAWGANDGSSWANAYTDLQDALADAVAGDEIWIAEGTYRPTSGTDRTATFALVSGVKVYGGFAGNEAYQHERDWRAHPTVLNGDIGTVNNSSDNAYHVVSGSGVNSNTVLDGVIVTGGRATGQDADSQGGGIYLSDASATLRSLALLGNTASQGGGLYVTGGSPTVVNAVFSGNTATSGGGLYNLSSSLTVTNGTFSENSGTQGGAVYNGGTATLANCIVWDEDPNQSLIAGGGTITVTDSDVRGGYGTGNLDADPQFMDAEGPDGIAGTLDDDLRLHTTFRFPSPVIDQGDNTALPVDAGDLDGDDDTTERLPFDVSARARLIAFTVVTPTVDMGAFEVNIEDVLAEGDALLAGGTAFRTQHLQLLPASTLSQALLNYSNFEDGEWYYAFCSNYANIDANGYCPETGPTHVRNDLLDAVDLYRVAVSVWPAAEWTTRAGEVIQVWQAGGRGVLGATVEIGNDHLIFGNEFLVDATDYRFSADGIPYSDQILAQELDELTQASRQFELVMDLVFRAFSEWEVGDYCTNEQFETFGVASSRLMSVLDEMATRYYMRGQTDKAREVYLKASRDQNMHLVALARLAEETGLAYLTNGSWEMLNNVSRMRERARAIEAGLDFFGFAADYAPLQSYDQLLELTEGPTGDTGLLGTAADLEGEARDAQRTFDGNEAAMVNQLSSLRGELDKQLFDLCGASEDKNGDGYGDYNVCEGGLMAQNAAAFESAYLRRGLTWMHAQNLARQIQNEQQRSGQVIQVALSSGQSIAADNLAIGKLQAVKTTIESGTSTESEFHVGGEFSTEIWGEVGAKASSQPSNAEFYASAAIKATAKFFLGGQWKTSSLDTTKTTWDPSAAAIGGYESIKKLKEAEAQATIEGANSAATIRNLLLQQSESLEEFEIASAELNKVMAERNHMKEKVSRLLNERAQAVPSVTSANSHLLNPAYRLWRDSLTTQSSTAIALAAQFAYLTARASEYELLTPFPNLGDVYKTRTTNDLRLFLDGLKVWHQALDLPGQLNRYPYALSVAEDLLNLTDEQLDPQGILSPEELVQKRYEELQQQLASRMLDGELEIVFATSLEQQRPGGQYFFSQNIWNNRIAGIGEPLASNVGVKVNIVTTDPVNAGVVEVVLVHDGKASYRNASGQEVSYDPATAVPVGYLVPAELSPAYTTVVLRPDINGQGGEPNSGLVNLSVAASRWKLRIPAGSWGNLDVSQIEDIQISIDTTGRALSGRGAQAADDADRLAAGLAMQPPSKEWLQDLAARQQDGPDRGVDAVMGQVVELSAPIIPSVVSGPYSGNLVMTSPITIAVQQLDLSLWNANGVLTGTVDVTETPFSPEPIGVSGTASGDQFILTSDVFTNVVNGRLVTQTFTLAGHAERDAEVLRAVYTSTIANLLPEPIIVQGLFIATRPGVPADLGLVVEAGAEWVPINTGTPVTVTLVDGTMQPITNTATTEQITFTTDLGAVAPATADMVDGMLNALFVAGSEPGETFVFATTGVMTGQVRIEIMPNDAPVADAGADQAVAPAAIVTLDGSGSSDPNGDALAYHWVQTGGEAVSFTPGLSITTFTAPTTAGQFTFALTVTDTGGLSDSDVTLVTVSNLAPTANAGPDQQVDPGATVTLDGRGSGDPNGDALAYHWTQTGGTSVGFSPNVSVTTFIAPAGSGPLTFVLTVTDTAGLAGTDSTVVTVRNLAPTANAGPDQTVDPGALVTLDGRGSSDPNGDALAYHWVQTGGLPVSFLPNASVTAFIAPLGAGQLTFALTVTDPGGLGNTDTAIVTVSEAAPTANAGPDQQVDPGATVTLDGRGSSDPNGGTLVYYWTQTGGTPVSLTPDASVTTFTAPPGGAPLTFALTVTDTAGLADTDSAVVTVRNLAPTADAGPDQAVDPGVTVVLDGSGSDDPNGDALVYHWVQTGGTPVSLAPNASITTFTAPVGAGQLTFSLTVTDTGGLSDADVTLVTVRNVAPAANAGPDQTVDPGATVTLDGRGSSDPNGDAIAYRWTQTGGAPVSFSPNISVTTFTAPLGAGQLTFALTVTDPRGLTDNDSTTVTVRNLAPTANAGADQQVDPGVTVTLDGRGSSDPNGDALVYHWVQTGGTPVSFSPNAGVVTFTAPLGSGPLTFVLTVIDPSGLSDTDSTVVTVRNLVPTANAGPDQVVDPGMAVTLDGRGSSDPNGDALVYHWVQTGGTPVSFAPNASITTFTAPVDAGQLTFSLTVTDTGGLAATDTALVTIANLGPVANAGPDQAVDPGVTVTLDGHVSHDPNGGALVYHWTQTGGIPVSFSPALSVTTFTAPLSAGQLTFALTVTDTAGLTGTDSTAVTVRNLAPVANAGAGQIVDPGVTVTLDGRGSSDPNGDAIAYYWVQTGGTPVSFSPAFSVTTFAAPLGSGALTFALTVTDTGGLAGSDTTVVAVRNLAPTANAGPDQQVDPGMTVTLDGSGSTDPNGDPLTYRWVQTGGTPVGFVPNASTTTFTAPATAGQLTFALTVTDTGSLAAADTALVMISNLGPMADAGPDQIVDPGTMVTLDGSGSSDPNGDALAYYWMQTGGTPVSFAPDASVTTFTAPFGAGQLTFALTVTDTAGLSATDAALVTVTNLAPLADAGPDQVVDPGVTVTLDGRGSGDPNGDALVYHWTQTGGTPVSFSPALSLTTFTAPLGAGQFTFILTITDTAGLTGTDSTAITVRNLAPTADAGADQIVNPGVTVTLDGRGSSDPNEDALVYHWVQTGGTPVSFSPTLSLTAFTAPSSAGLLSFALTVTDTAGLAATDTTVVSVLKTRIYLPLITKNTVYPDLVIRSLVVTSETVEVVFENQGSTFSPPNAAFYVDVYIAPSPAPTQVNQTWDDLCEQGIVWSIPGEDLPLEEGAVMTLTFSTDPRAPNLYYREDLSYFPGSLPEGTAVYAQVDSWNQATTYGTVLELHEKLNRSYNNIMGPVYSTPGSLHPEEEGAEPSPVKGATPTFRDALPPRP